MSEIEIIKARLANAEKALFTLATVLLHLQPPETQQSINAIMNDYFDANTSLGFEPNTNFISGDS